MRLLTIREACELTTLSRTTLLRRIADGSIAASRCGRRLLIPEAAVAQLVERGAVNDAARDLITHARIEAGLSADLSDHADDLEGMA